MALKQQPVASIAVKPTEVAPQDHAATPLRRFRLRALLHRRGELDALAQRERA
jgi:hypothetical protein